MKIRKIHSGLTLVELLIAAFVRGYSGFGYSALVISASGLVTNPLNFVAVTAICEAFLTAQAWRGVGPNVDWHRVCYLLVGAAVGLPLGLWALTSISVDAARATISAYVLLMSGVLLVGWRLKAQVGAGGTTYVANPADMNAFTPNRFPSNYVEFDERT